jgi:hypothetical protein
MQKSPQKTYKKHGFTYNKQNHPEIQAIFNFSRVTTINTFANNVTPPQTLSISQENQLEKQYSTAHPVLMKIQH